VEVVMAELFGEGSAYEPVDRTEADLCEDLKRDLLARFKVGAGGKKDCPRLPTFGWTVKDHKHPSGRRFIAFGGSCVLSTLEEDVALCVSAMMRRLREMDRENVLDGHPRRLFIVKDSAEVVPHIARLVKDQVFDALDLPDRLRSFDCTTMFTAIDHEELFKAFDWLCDLVFSGRARAEEVLVVDGRAGRAEFARQAPTGGGPGRVWSRAKLVEAVRYLVEHAFIVFGSYVVRQRRGFPMGGHESPMLADLTLAYYEWEFQQFWTDHDLAVARAFEHTTRYLDDLLVVANVFWDQFLYFDRVEPQGGAAAAALPDAYDVAGVPPRYRGVYPRGMLKFTETSCDPSHARVHYLDLDLSVAGRHRGEGPAVLRCDIWDKRVDLHIPIIRYPDPRSMLSPECGAGIILSQAYRFVRRVRSQRTWVRQTGGVIRRLSEKGYSATLLRRKIWVVAGRFAPVFSTSSHTLARKLAAYL
jgi:hypothetical protein